MTNLQLYQRRWFEEDDLDEELGLDDKVIIIGDLNARHKSWDNNSNNTNGTRLYNY